MGNLCQPQPTIVNYGLIVQPYSTIVNCGQTWSCSTIVMFNHGKHLLTMGNHAHGQLWLIMVMVNHSQLLPWSTIVCCWGVEMTVFEPSFPYLWLVL